MSSWIVRLAIRTVRSQAPTLWGEGYLNRPEMVLGPRCHWRGREVVCPRWGGLMYWPGETRRRYVSPASAASTVGTFVGGRYF